MLNLDSEQWTSLTHAYGAATGTPALLRRFDRELRSGALSEEALEQLTSSLLHQGDVYPATVAALPHLVSASDASKNLLDRLRVWSAAGYAARGLARVERLGSAAYAVVTADMWMAFDAAIARASASAISDALASTGLADEWRPLQLVSVADLHGWHDLALAIEGLSQGELAVPCEECGGEAQVDPADLRGPDGAERAVRTARGVDRARSGGSHVADEAPAELIAGLTTMLAPMTMNLTGDLADLAERIFGLQTPVPCPECDAPITLVSPARFGLRSPG